MVMLVTLQEASDHLRRDNDADDNDLVLKIHAASNSVLNYLKDFMLAYQFEIDDHGVAVLDSSDEIVYLEDSSGEFIAREEVKHAVLIVLGVYYNEREGENYTSGDSRSGRIGSLHLPRAVYSILDCIRTPTLA